MTSGALSIITGAPGSGKTSALAAFLDLQASFIAVDMDWLIDSASALVGRDIHFEASAWPAYNALWFEVLHCIARNGHTPVLFGPIAPADLPAAMPPWCDAVSWLLLDCTDEIRISRLRARGWPAGRVQEAIRDAADLRTAVDDVVRTDEQSAGKTASAIAAWLNANP
jgi:broad-specificity NMP kinase